MELNWKSIATSSAIGIGAAHLNFQTEISREDNLALSDAWHKAGLDAVRARLAHVEELPELVRFRERFARVQQISAEVTELNSRRQSLNDQLKAAEADADVELMQMLSAEIDQLGADLEPRRKVRGRPGLFWDEAELAIRREHASAARDARAEALARWDELRAKLCEVAGPILTEMARASYVINSVTMTPALIFVDEILGKRDQLFSQLPESASITFPGAPGSVVKDHRWNGLPGLGKVLPPDKALPPAGPETVITLPPDKPPVPVRSASSCVKPEPEAVPEAVQMGEPSPLKENTALLHEDTPAWR